MKRFLLLPIFLLALRLENTGGFIDR